MIPQIKKILYATDLSKNSAYAAYFALDLAHKYEAKIVMLHCTERIFTNYGLTVSYIPQAEEVLSKETEEAEVEIKKRLGEFYRNVGSTITPAYAKLVSDIIVRPGYAVEEILNTADAEECDVIVLGTHSKGWLKQTFLGSTARAVLERTRKPVFIIPLPSEKIPGIDSNLQ